MMNYGYGYGYNTDDVQTISLDRHYGGPGSYYDTSSGHKSRYKLPRGNIHRNEDNSSSGRGGRVEDDEIYRSPFHISKSLEDSQRWFQSKCRMLAQNGKMFEDPHFSASSRSLYFSKRAPSNIEWRRPKEIHPNAEFEVGGVSRFDVRQGELGDCWLLAAVASLSLHPGLLKQVVPSGQRIDSPHYCGMFLFRFWQFGDWVDVVVDDRLPVSGRMNSLIYMHSTEKNEFWSALLEKAYAKLNGSYEALKGGSTTEAMEDFTGGITELFELHENPPRNLYDIMLRANNRRSLMGCSIDAEPNEVEAKAPLGLIKGHAYSITDVKRVRTRGGTEDLIRIRNPWGNEDEWKGPWSDRSPEWNNVSSSQRQELQQRESDDGEFWMCFRDFIHYYTKLEVCHLNPDSDDLEKKGGKKRSWHMTKQEAEWKKNTTAGGCRNFIETFHMNPQFKVSVIDPDEDDDDNTGTLIIGLMQKNMRKKKSEGVEMLTIGYAVYRCPSNFSGVLDNRFFRTNASVARSPAFINMREICGRHKLNPGDYVVVPSTFRSNEEAQFILRVFSEEASKSEEMDDVTEMNPVDGETDRDMRTDNDDKVERKLKSAFEAIAGEDEEIDIFELRDILNVAFKHEFVFDGFSVETCRSMVSMLDDDQSGKLGFEEFKILWRDLRLWKTIFKRFDTDKSGNMNHYEIRNCLNQVGFKVSNRIFNSITTRYTNKEGLILFDDYIVLLVRMKTIFETYKAQDKTRDGRAIFSSEDFIRSVIYV